MHGYSGSVLEDNVYLGHEELSAPYFINCCGYLKHDGLDVSLERTRMDFYLIYLINGAGHYITSSGTVTAKAGSIVLYRPGEHQHYFYEAADKAELYWIHFTGGQAESFMKELGFNDSHFFQAGMRAEYIELFENIIHELQMKKPHYHQLSISYFLQLLTRLSRGADASGNGEKKSENSDLEAVIKVMNEQFHHEHAMDHYAKMSNLSVFQFIRNFKKRTRYSPAKYIEKLRIAKAKELLRDSNLSIAEISAVVGYRDPFYFSKVFKKTSGATPSDFRGRA
ncbi:helix-turn-helix domain-containing protein [Paenibacillus sp. LHD-117]|uniref:helix-turn-helix domain-containing protein n=1 Tax=Paenibacillus sp. LHD-117 TaxID=3071412 RepID=UPI0027E1E2E6|nr:helix-turn-helix domain-containing protein [Paenibacillus sp. LHD-117]MDQ6422804.1 helix-turn-helix domain-containing protein [Paenibacillus sp. LHD-117]